MNVQRSTGTDKGQDGSVLGFCWGSAKSRRFWCTEWSNVWQLYRSWTGSGYIRINFEPGGTWWSDWHRSRSLGSKNGIWPYSNIFEYGWASIILYPYRIVFISSCIHIQSEALGPYRIRIYLNIFKAYFSASYFWPALPPCIRSPNAFKLLELALTYFRCMSVGVVNRESNLCRDLKTVSIVVGIWRHQSRGKRKPDRRTNTTVRE
jgi:hypothetical protein